MFMRTRAVAVVAALAAGVAGGGLLAAPAQAGVPDCDFTKVGTVWTLTADCEVTSAIDVPDGVTVDGAGRTITAVEGDTSYAGHSVLRSAEGTALAVATLNVKNLHIRTTFKVRGDSVDLLFGIYMLSAGGAIDNVTVDGISHGNPGQKGRAIWIKNDLASEAVVTITNTTVTNYQKSGVYLTGNVNFDVRGLTVGRAGGPKGEAIDGIAANGVTIMSGAHGSLTDSKVAPNYYDKIAHPDDNATGILVFDANKVTLARNIVSGVKGNVGIDVSDDRGFDAAAVTDVAVSCTLVQIAGAQAPGLVGVSNVAPAKLALRDSTVTGFDTAVSGTTPSAGNGDCLAPAPKVKALAGDHAVDVVWSRVAAPAYAPVTGQVVVLSAPGEADRTVTLDATADWASFTGLTAGVTYTATVRVTNVSGNATGSATAKVAADPPVPGLAPAPKVKAFAGDHAVDVVWTLAATPAYAPITGQGVVLSAPGEADRKVTLGATADSASFTGLTAGVTYTATVSVTNAVGTATGSATAKIATDPTAPAVAQKITLNRNHKKVVKGHSVVFTGKLTPARPGITVNLLTRTGGHWVVLKSTVVKADSTFRFKWKATKPYSTHHFKVRSAAANGFLSGLSPCRDVKVKKH